MTEQKKIIVTGATGSIGCAVVKQAVLRGYDVTCIVHRGSTRVNNIMCDAHVHVIECDLSEYESLELEGKYDALIHLAWEKTFGASRDDVDVQTRNIQYTLDACRLAKRCGCEVFIGAGSQAEYGVQTVALTQELPVQPESGYGIAKFTAGKMSLMLCKQLGIRGNWIRVLSVFGSQDGANTLINYAINELKSGRSPKLTKCEQTWDYLYADDAADGFLDVAERGANGKVYVIGSGKPRKLYEYINDVRSVVNPQVEVEFGAIEYYPHQPMYLVADITELTKDTGWVPKISFIKGIKSIVYRV